MAPSSQEPGHVWKVILIEDDADLRQSIVKYLQLDGIEVTGLSTAIEMYREISVQSFAAAIVDLSLPDQYGMVLVEYLRQNTDMRIFVLTAHALLENRLAAYQAGADIFLVKPVDFRELSASIRSQICRTKDAQRSAPLISPDNEKAWRLLQATRELVSPDGISVKLTTKEHRLLLDFVDSAGRAIPRNQLLTALEYQRNEYGNRSLDTLVSRLRKKALALGNFPLITDQGSGYTFTATLLLA